MDFTFTDISSSFVSMVRQDLPREVMFDTGNAGFRKPLFAEKLDKTLEKDEPSGTMFQTKLDPAAKDSKDITGSLLEKLTREKGTDFISALKSIFLKLSKGDLKNVSIDEGGLEALKKMLLKAGFKENDINDLIAGFSEELANKDLTLDKLFGKLVDLPFEAKTRTRQDTFFDTSAIPFFHSILTSLGIPVEKIQDMLAKADKGEKGLSLNELIEKLQALQKESFYRGDHYETKQGDDNFTLVLKHLNLDQGGRQTSPLTLDELIGSLEKLRKNLLQSKTPGEALINKGKNPYKTGDSSDLLNALFKGLEIKEKTPGTQTFEFSYDQVKDQFKNELLVPGRVKTGKKDLFSSGKKSQHAADAKLKDSFKEMESLLSRGKKGDFSVNNQKKGIKDFLTQGKSGSDKLSDQSPVAGHGGKTGQAQSGLNILKTKPAFKNLPAYVTQQVSKSLVRAVNQGENTLRIQLKPPELGRLMITIDNTGNNIKINIMTENHAAKEILASNVHELRTVLSNSGVNLERFDVDMNSNFRQSMTDARNQAGNFGKRNKNKGKRLFDPVNAERMNDPMSLLNALNRDGALHFVA
ncbi:MAG: flagellar hook-length control protein FliK [Deltaproteobacteria bacterium]|nr:flagellar hook-length control protein FliK [Deltaproteobacteria bacterium]